ncbi:MAG: feruloyl-CoA synthase [Mesorhizobium sp.]|nr:feruloyl-CoA synthase [Mesorhizobium sp.]MCO5162582.1 feruloyl-CoA synthase [Mesorhizobium sp.]
MPLVDVPGMRPVMMGDLAADLEARDDGSILVRPRAALGDYPRSMTDCLARWARERPDTVFLADRGPDGEWRRITYAQALDKARSLAQFLIDHGLSAERPLMVLSGNSMEHGLLALAAMMAGIPIAPVSPAYSLVSTDHQKLRYLVGLLTPGMIFAADGRPYEKALRAILAPDMTLLIARDPVADLPSAMFEAAAETVATSAVDAADAAVTPDTVSKFLFTSGSTGMPKAVINTQRMMTCNQVMIASALAFLKDEPPVMVDWLPWNHTAGGNHNFGITLHNGGTLYIDDGSPTPAGILKTVRNLEEIAPTLYFNVPKGYEMLLDHFEKNERLRKTFFSRLNLMQYAGAGLSQHVWDGLDRIAREATGERIMIITGYGATETAPFAFTTTWAVERAGEVGLPAPGLELKLVPNADKLEVRLRGPNVTPGYWRQPDKTAECFDEEGFYMIGDALKFVDPQDVNRGLLFDGRVSEDFKLNTGTWVNLASVKAAIIRAFAPYVREAVLTGLNRNHIGAMLFLDVDAARKLSPDLAVALETDLADSPVLRALFQERLDALAKTSTGSASFVARALILDTPPAIDKGEITDKGSINQRAVMAARAKLVEDLYAEPPPSHVFVARKSK